MSGFFVCMFFYNIVIGLSLILLYDNQLKPKRTGWLDYTTPYRVITFSK